MPHGEQVLGVANQVPYDSLAGVEATPEGQYVMRSASGVLTHANHCVSPDLLIHDSTAREFPETLARGALAQYLAPNRKVGEAYITHNAC